jgi:hypothetical protein
MKHRSLDISPRAVRLAMPALAVFLISVAVIGLELALMRCLSVASWHHFSYLVISTALLGFGASGTLLTLIGDRLEERFELWNALFAVLFAFSVPLSFRAAQALPLNFQYAFYSLHQAGLALAYHLIILIPFLLGALVIGFALMHFSEDVHLVYGANLFGSGIGGVWMILVMFLLPETHLLYAVAGMGLLSGMCWAGQAGVGRISRQRSVLMMGSVVLAGATLALLDAASPLRLRIDEYKTLAGLRRLERQGQATRRLTRHGPRGRVDVYDSPHFHGTLSLSLTAERTPPPQSKLLINGSSAGNIYRIDTPEEAAVLDRTVMSVPYRLLDSPEVLLLGETDGTNVWLARRWQAAAITAIQRNPQIVELMLGPLSEMSGHVFGQKRVTTETESPRLFLERTDRKYDLIQFVHGQGMAAGTSGMQAMQEDYLLTVEGFALAMRRLTSGGILSITRGTQSPPRDNLKILFSVVRGLECTGRDDPSRHLAIVHDYMTVTTLVSAEPFGEARCERLRNACDALQLDLDWSPCESLEPSNDRARIPGPADSQLSWYHRAASRIFSSERNEFLENWIYNVRPATDDSPYFYNFFRWKSVPVLRRTFGPGWFRKAEMGYLIVLGTLGEVVVVGVILILLPLLWLRSRHSGAEGPVRGRLPTVIYFLLLGITFMMVEMALIIRFAHFLGDPILSAGGVLSAFLAFSGLGSSLSRRIVRRPTLAVGTAVLGIAAVGIGYEFILDPIIAAGASWPTAIRFLVAVLLAAPLAFLMGWPFPNGLARVQAGSPPLVPWAWSVNGFASVAGTPVAVLLAVSHGFSTVMLLGVVLYGCAALMAWKLPAGDS